MNRSRRRQGSDELLLERLHLRLPTAPALSELLLEFIGCLPTASALLGKGTATSVRRHFLRSACDKHLLVSICSIGGL